MATPINSVSDLMRVAVDHDYDEPVFAQVVGDDGSAWNMTMNAGRLAPGFTGLVIQLTHPELGTLVKKDQTQLPTNEAEARAMIAVGTKWLQDNLGSSHG